jgi:glutaryl-CoA dehydrogenase
MAGRRRPFTGVDFYDVDSLLGDEERAIRDQVRVWVEDRYLPLVDEAWERGTFPVEVVPELARLGLLGATLPEQYGGAGIGAVAYGLAMQELERGDSGLRSFASVQGSLAMHAIFAFGDEAQRARWLPPMARGEAIGCFGLTEPDAGSDPGGMLTRAARDRGDYVLDGTKMWITNGSIADVAVVWAKLRNDDRDEASGKDEVRGFLVEKGTPGFSAPEQRRKLSMRASVTSELVLSGARVPASSLLPGARGLRAPLACLSQARFGVAFGVVGAAMACFDAAVEHGKTRTTFGKPIGGHQLVQAELADMLTAITQAQLLSVQLGRLKERDAVKPEQISLAKRANCAMALDVARRARDLLGASGITADYPVMRHMCNLESVKTYEGTHNIHTLVLGEAITGVPAYR